MTGWFERIYIIEEPAKRPAWRVQSAAACRRCADREADTTVRKMLLEIARLIEEGKDR